MAHTTQDDVRGSSESRDDTGTADEHTGRLLTGKMLAAAIVSAVSGLLYGYDTGIISGALLQISKEFDIGSGMKQAIAAGILLGAVIGALTCSFLSERWGRHKTIIMICAIFVTGSLLCAISPSDVLLALSRIVLGFAVGGATQTVPMYVAELSPTAIRGRLVLCFQLAIGVGIVIATIVGAASHIDWRISIGAACVPAALMLIFQLRLPESPRWLIKHGRQEEAEEVLRSVRPDGYDINPEVREIKELEERKKEAKAKDRGWSGLKQPWVRPAVIAGCGLAIFTQLSGIEMIVYYAPTILTDNGFSDNAALNVSVALGLTYLILQIGGLWLVDKVGRRRLTLIMTPGAVISMVVLGSFFVFDNAGKDSTPYIIACLISFMAFTAGGIQLMGWLVGSEIYPLASRSAGTSLQSASLWSTNLLITLTLLSMMDLFGVGQVFWIYAGFNVAAFVFVYLKLPEITGHSLEDIEAHLRDGNFTPKDFARSTAS